MKRRTLITQTAILTLLIASVFARVHASYSTSILYSKFNNTDWYTEELDKAYTGVSIDVKCHLTFNATGTPAAKVAFMNDTTGTPKGIILLFFKDGTEKVFVNDGLTEVQIATGEWAAGNATRIILTNQKVTIYDFYGVEDSETKILEGFSFDEDFANVRAMGTTNYTATDGYMQVDVGAGAASTAYVISDFMPTLLSLAMLGMAIGMISKYGR